MSRRAAYHREGWPGKRLSLLFLALLFLGHLFPPYFLYRQKGS